MDHEAPAALPGQHNLPAPLTSLLGRATELHGVAEALRKSRLVTLTGPGGVGKTRLALELARRQVGRRAGGVWLVDLTAGTKAPDVAAETARTLDVGSRGDATWTEALVSYLAERDPLLVLDNCEHVIEASAELADNLLASCPNVRIMATSREIFDVPGERVWRLEPLDADEACRLFVERARARRPEFMPDERADETIIRICERLDRLPLAIELAAARVGVMSAAEILAGLEARLGELGGGRLAPPRHRTVRATVEWSHKLLETAEQDALRDLAVFVGGFDAEAGAAVAPGLSPDVLARLVDKSLISVSESPSGRTRYRLLETVREYALERLMEAGELEAARERHRDHFAALAPPVPEGWPSPAAPRLVSELQDDYENVRAALEFSAASDPCSGMPFLAGAWDLFFMLGQADGLRLGELLLGGCPKRDRTRASVQVSVAVLRLMQADVKGTTAMLADALELSIELGERALEGWALLFQGLAATFGGLVVPGREALTRARDLHHELGVRVGEGRAIAALGLVELNSGAPEPAMELVEEALEIQAATGDLWSRGQCQVYLGMIAEDAGSPSSQATAHYRQAVDSLRPYGSGPLLPIALALQGGIVASRDARRGLRIIAAASAIRARAGGEFAPLFRERVDRGRSVAEAALGDEAAAVWAEGSRLSIDEAIALAFGTATARTSRPAGLSQREAEVARLVAKGLSNKQIASTLQLSVRTVEDHVRHALAKTGLENRTQLATWVSERTP
ncbi:MAG TPA: LuxR C-terminal-related transcriptional regulator [Solirubrobacterales bacterium]|nr:LuxR C-terminal-related transcriptional regulator [Solirubrobacterales bacterium]